jgi:hypothetical protein
VKYYKEEIDNSYSKFLEIEKNQIDIFQQMRTAMCGLTALESFTGDGATAAKDYVTDVHCSVIDTFCVALMELEIRFLALKQDFEATVDDSGTAILDDQFITDKSKELALLRDKVVENTAAATDAIIPVLGYASVDDYNSQLVLNCLDLTKSKMDDVLTKMSQFNTRHLNDLNDFSAAFPLLDQALQYMTGKVTPTEVDFSRSEFMDCAWAQQLSDYRVRAFLYSRSADPALFETFYLSVIVNCGFDVLEYMIEDLETQFPDIDLSGLYIALKDGDVDSWVGLAGQGAELAAALQETIRLMRSGLVFTPVVENGEVWIKIRARNGLQLSNADRIKALEIAEGPNQIKGHGTLTKLFHDDRGLCVWANGRQYATRFGKAVNFEDAAKLAEAVRKGDFSAAGTLSKTTKVMRGVGKVGKGLGIAGDVLTVAMDVADSFYDERTGTLTDSFDGAKLAGGLAVDGVIAATVVAGAAAGTALFPGLGTAAGAISGLVVGTVITIADQFEYGEPPKSIIDHAKDGLTDCFQSVGDFFAKVFF